jgi:hypothetical protein
LTGASTVSVAPRPRLPSITSDGDLVVEQALHAGHRRGLAHEQREVHLDATAVGFELAQHPLMQCRDRGHVSSGASRRGLVSSSSAMKRDMCVPFCSSGSAT